MVLPAPAGERLLDSYRVLWFLSTDRIRHVKPDHGVAVRRLAGGRGCVSGGADASYHGSAEGAGAALRLLDRGPQRVDRRELLLHPRHVRRWPSRCERLSAEAFHHLNGEGRPRWSGNLRSLPLSPR